VEDDESYKNFRRGLKNALAAVADEARVGYLVHRVKGDQKVDKEFRGTKETREIEENEAREDSQEKLECPALGVSKGSLVPQGSMEFKVNRVTQVLLDHRDTRALQVLQEQPGPLGQLGQPGQLDDKEMLGQLGGKETLVFEVRRDLVDLLAHRATRASRAPQDRLEHPVVMVFLDPHLQNNVDAAEAAAAVMVVEGVYTVDQLETWQMMLSSMFFRLEVDADALRIIKAMLVVINAHAYPTTSEAQFAVDE
jgi:hypothetical protein